MNATYNALGPAGSAAFEETLAHDFPTSTAADFAPLEGGIVDEDTYAEQGLKWADAHFAYLHYIFEDLGLDPDLLLLGTPTTDEFQHQFFVNRPGNVYGMSWLPGTASTGGPSERRNAAAAACWSGRPRCVRSPLATTSSGAARSISVASGGSTRGASRVPTWRSETCRMRVGRAEPLGTLIAMVDEPTEIFDDLYLGLRAGGAMRKKRRGEPLTMEEEEALGRWESLSGARKAATVGAFAIGTFGLGFTLGGLIFGRWRKA